MMTESVPVKRDDQSTRQSAQEGQLLPRREADLWRGDPFRDIDTLFDRMLRRFDMPMSARWPQGFTPPVDIEETDDAYVFEFELPGVKRDDINIEVGAQELRINGEIHEKQRTGVLRHSTRRSGNFDYRVALPSGVDPERVEAHFNDGVLNVTVRRAEASKPRKVKIN
jgi:HSP20 family protein